MAGHDFDFFVIGGGSGGVRAGRLAAGMGKRVGIAEEYRYGGTCVIRGCVPKKLMVYASHYSEAFEDAAGFGWRVGESHFDWKTLIARKDNEIARLEGLYRKGLENAGATIYSSRAVLELPNTIRLVNENRTVTAERILIATGGTPQRLESLPGHELCISSNEVFHLEEQPRSIVIKGGGYIAVEFACIFAGLGTRTTLVYRGDHILRGFDHDLAHHLGDEMAKRGINLVLGANIKSVEKVGRGLVAHIDNGTSIETDQVMLAVGRLPNTAGLGLEKAGVATDRIGDIKVDSYSRTNVPHILAVGDVTNRVALTPVAIHEAMCLIETEFRNNPVSPDHDLIPTAVFSQPEIGTVGMSEEAAARSHHAIAVYRALFRPMKHTLSGRDEKMLMKIIVEEEGQRVVGVHILGPDAGEMAQCLGIALKMGAKKQDFDRTMAVHPTAAEELVTMYSPSYRIVDGKRVSA
ncbi:MAG: glutathione-disulfide reductase [Rhizobiaceae bacterium]